MSNRLMRFIVPGALFAILTIIILAYSGVLSQRTWSEQTVFSMGTLVDIRVPGRHDAAINAAFARMNYLADLFDRFHGNGDVIKLNHSNGKWVLVSPETLRVTAAALEIARISEGVFDPTIAPVVDLWGFGDLLDTPANSPKKPPGQQALAAALQRVDFRAVQVDLQHSQIRLRQGQQLDLGGIAKGYIADALANELRAQGIKQALVNVGGNLFALGGSTFFSPWRIGIRHPRDAGKVIAAIEVRNAGVSTSGDYERYFVYQGRRYSHLIDPKSGYPRHDLISVTVIAPTGMEADALSTAAFVLGPRTGLELLERLPGVEGVLIDDQLQVHYTSGLRGKITLLGTMGKSDGTR